MLITEGYREQQRKLHENPDYGRASLYFAPIVANIVTQGEIRTIADIGCGKGRLADELVRLLPQGTQVEMHLYDPAIPDRAEPPQGKFDLVTCIDVLEHVEPEFVDSMLDSLAGWTGRFAFLTIHTGPAKKVLDDGRNAHLIQEPPRWWLPKILARWDLHTFQRTPHGFWVICNGTGELQ